MIGKREGQNNGHTDRIMGGQTNERMDNVIYVHRHAKNNDFPIDSAIFTKALRTDGRIDRRTDGRTDQLMDGQTLL